MTLRIVQITDCHLFADRSVELKGVLTWQRLHAVLNVIRAEHANLDCLIVTGDTAHDEDAATYTAFRDALGEFVDRLWILPGNHDDRAGLESVFPDRCVLNDGRLVFEHGIGHWQLIGLDSQVTGEVAGRIGSDQFAWLSERLASLETKHAVVFVHHPPVPMRSPWLDAIGLEDGPELLDLLRSNGNVRLVCCGHVHQESTTSLSSLTVLTTPAVGPQFRPRTEENLIDPLPAAARLIELETDGSWSSQVIRMPVADS